MKSRLSLVFLIVAIVASCNSPKKQQDAHDHQESENKVQYTAYSEDFELFAEADPFIVGQNVEVLSHFSHIPSFTALEEGSVTVSLVVGNGKVSQVLEKPTRKGIYKFTIKPEVEGKGQLVFDFKIGENEYQLVVPNVVVYYDELEAMAIATGSSATSTNTVSFTKEQSWKIEFGTELPRIEPFGQVIKTSAQVMSAHGDEAIIAAKTNGVVVFKDNNVIVGKNVSEGQSLFAISGAGMTDNNASVRFAEAQNNYEKANVDYERAKELAKDKIIAEKELLAVKNEYENAKAIYDNLKKHFNINGQVVVSPQKGFIKQVYVNNGEYVEMGQPVLSVSQNRTLMLKADVQQKYAAMLPSITSAIIRVPNNNQAYTIEQLNGKIISFGQSANEDNYLVPVSVQIDNKVDFIQGAVVELYLKTMTNRSALTIPTTSLVEEQGNYYVFVQINPELFEKREVKIGVTDGQSTEILKGLLQTERVVSKGAIQVKLAQATGTLDAHSGHTH